MKQDIHEPRAYGMVVGVRNATTKAGELMYAEIMPATDLSLNRKDEVMK